MNQILSLKRIGLLLKMDFFYLWRNWLFKAALVAGIILIYIFVGELLGSNSGMSGRGKEDSLIYDFILVVLAITTASNAFGDIHDKRRSDEFLLIPASITEKVIVKIFVNTILISFFILVVILLSKIILFFLAKLLLDAQFDMQRFIEKGNFVVLGHLIIFQSIYVLGSAWFKKNHFVKTTLTLILINIVFSIAIALFVRLMFFGRDGNFNFNLYSLNDFFPESLSGNRWQSMWLNLLKVFYYAIIPVFCWVTTWFRVKEIQSSDAI